MMMECNIITVAEPALNLQFTVHYRFDEGYQLYSSHNIQVELQLGCFGTSQQ